MVNRNKKTQRQPVILLIVVLLLFSWSSKAAAAAPVTVYYFHSTVRCADCRQIEQMTGEILQQTFPQELADGRLKWRPLNVDLPENTHFVYDFDLAANELVVLQDEDQSGWGKVAEVWTLAHDPAQLRTQLVQMVRKALAQMD